MRTITVIGARGGSGCSTLILEMARQVIESGKTVRIIDSDPWQELVADAEDFQSVNPDYILMAGSRHLPVSETDHIIVIVPAEVRAIAAAAQLLPEFERHALVSLVVRSPGPTPIKPAKISQLLQLPLAAVLKVDPKLAVLGEHGSRANKSLQQTARDLLRYLEIE